MNDDENITTTMMSYKNNNNLREIREQTKEFEQKFIVLDNENNRINSKISPMEQRIQDLYQRITENDNKLNEIKLKSESMNLEVDIANAVSEYKENYLNSLVSIVKSIKESIEKVNKEREKLKDDLLLKNDEFNKWQDEHANFDAFRDIKLKEEIELDELKLINLQKKSKFDQQKTTLQKSKELDDEIIKWKDAVEQNELKLNNKYEEIESVMKEMSDTTKEIDELQKQIERIQKQIEDRQAKHNQQQSHQYVQHQQQHQQQQQNQYQQPLPIPIPPQQKKRGNQRLLMPLGNHVGNSKITTATAVTTSSTITNNSLHALHQNKTQQLQQQQPFSVNTTTKTINAGWNKQPFGGTGGQNNFLLPIQQHHQNTNNK